MSGVRVRVRVRVKVTVRVTLGSGVRGQVSEVRVRGQWLVDSGVVSGVRG